MPKAPDAADIDAIAAHVEEHSDYVYLGGRAKVPNGSKLVLAHEKPEGLEEGIHILFVDGHVEYVCPIEQAMQLIEETKQQRDAN
jgi:prepilin-type processing-associated H-X9-DG protein